MSWIAEEALDLALNGAADLAESVIGRKLRRRSAEKERPGEKKQRKAEKERR